MAKQIGQEVEVAITKESTRGTAETAVSGDWLERGEFGIGQTKDSVEVDANIGVKVTRRDTKAVHFENELTITMPLESNAIGKFLLGVMGSVSTTADDPEAGVQTHDFSILDTRLNPTWTLSVIDANARQRVYALGLITSFTLTLTPDDLPTVTVVFRTKKAADTSGLTAAYGSPSYYSPVDAEIKMPLTFAGLGAANALDIIEVTIEMTIPENVIHKYLGADTQSDISAASYDCSIHVVKHKDEETFSAGDTEYIQDDFEAHSQRAFQLDLVDTSTTIGAATNPSVKIIVPAGRIENYDPSQDLKDVVGEEFDFMPVNTDTVNGFVTGEVINEETSY